MKYAQFIRTQLQVESDMQKLLYLSPVDWRWAKQRPQFLAEALDKYYNVHVAYPFKNKRKGLQKKRTTSAKLYPLFSLPTLNRRLSAIAKFNVFLFKLQLQILLHMVKPDYLWLSMPWQIASIPRNTKCKIIYDCMDDYAAITARPEDQNELIQQEQLLFSRADVIFASSEHLRKVIETRCSCCQKPIHLLRNGCNADWLSSSQEEDAITDKEQALRIGYIGTIGRWFDFSLLLNSLKADCKVEYHLYGPLESGITIPQHERLVYHGVIEHDQIHHCAAKMHALMMPFLINDIVLSVDPVKLYEYIWMNKPIISIYYPEIERFKEFVMFYRSQEEFLHQLQAVKNHHAPCYTKQQAIEFLSQNNWKTRAAQAKDIIEKYCRTGGINK